MELPIDNTGYPISALRLGDADDVDGTAAHAESNALDSGVYAIAVVSSATTGVRIMIGEDPEAIATSTYLPTGAIITPKIINGEKVSVLGGKINITKLE